MITEGIASSIGTADVQATYYALQKQLNAAWAVNQSVVICLPLLLFFSGLGARTFDLLRRRLKFWWLAAFAFFFALALIALATQSAVIHFVLTIKSEVEASSMPGLSTFLLAKLPEVVVVSGLVGLAGILLCYILYFGPDRKRRLTWLWLSVLTTVLAGMALMAVPAFTATQSLGNTPVERDIARMAGQLGIPLSRIAKEHCAGDADCPPGHVIGLGPTRLILLDDRLSARTPEEQLLQVFAHEAKHFLLDNNLKPVVLIFLISAVLFLVTQTLSGAILARQRLRYASVADQAKAVPLVFGVGLATFILLPAINTYRQHVEFEADRFGLELNRNNQALIDIMRSDAATNPMLYKFTPLTRYFRGTHPEIRTRIEFAESYRPWVNGAPLVYSRHFKDKQ